MLKHKITIMENTTETYSYFQRLGYFAKSLDDGNLYQYTIDENDIFYIDYGNNHLVERNIDDFEILEVFFLTDNKN